MKVQDRKLQVIMGLYVSIGLAFIFMSCNGKTGSTQSQITESKNLPIVNKFDTLQNQFVRFREFVIGNKKNDTKAFFDFPIKNDDLWYKVLEENEVDKYIGSPFTEKDFEIYFDSIFTESFKKCLSNIDIEQLFNSGKFSTNFVVSRENNYLVKNQIEATYSNGELKLTFNSVVQDNADETEAEHTEIYIFNFISNRLKLETFYMAG